MGGRLIVSFLSELNGTQALVFGAGVTGAPTVAFLKKRGATVYVIDEKISQSDVYNSLEEIDLTKVSLAIVSPGWQLDNPLINLI